MPLDPFSALAIAASIVQFVDFAGKIVSKGKELYTSPSGVLSENERTETVTKRLRALALDLQKSSQISSKARPEVQSPPPWVVAQSENADELSLRQKNQWQARNEYLQQEEDEKQRRLSLQSICDECIAISAELLKHLQDLKVPKGQEHRRWKSFRHALKCVWSKSGIDEMARRLVVLREELDTHVLALLREKTEENFITQDRRFSQLHKDIQLIIRSILHTKLANSEELQKHFEALTNSQKEEHAKTRASFIYTETEKRKSLVQSALLESLRFPTMNDRYLKLAQAHEKTFQWIFEDPARHKKSWDDFVKWLSTDSGTYWIQGKAASGKSTLMRFILDNPRTSQCLNNWAKGGQPVVAAFFFWNSGVPDQRSHSGLLRSLLYEVLKDRHDLIPEVLAIRWEKTSSLAARDLGISIEWSLSELKICFEKLVRAAGPSFRICFFIDGLDEYDGDPEDISQFFSDLSKISSYAKFCVSSRPWPIFLDIYDEVPGLKLQELTHDDIVLFIVDKLEKSKPMKRFLLVDSKAARGLIEEIVTKAMGVFLWVALVVKSLVNGLRSGDEISHLRRRLESLPADLGDLYGHMLDSIDPLDREEASKMFQVFRQSGHHIDLPNLERAIRPDGFRQALELPIRTTSCSNEESQKTNMGIERMTLRLNSRSKGLLEVRQPETLLDEPYFMKNVGIPSFMEELPLPVKVWAKAWIPCAKSIDSARTVQLHSIPYHENRSDWLRKTSPLHNVRLSSLQVSYLHRTVKDYLEQDGVWKNLLQHTKHTDFNAKTALLVADILELKTTDKMFTFKSIYHGSTETLTKVCQLAPLNLEPQVLLLEELGRSFCASWIGEVPSRSINNDPWRYDGEYSRQQWRGDCFDISRKVMWGLLKWYTDTGLLSASESSCAIPRSSLLAYALGSMFWSLADAIERAPIPHYNVVEHLLCFGCDPNASYSGLSLWDRAVSFIHDLNTTEEVLQEGNLASLLPWIPLCKLLLEHGADPNAHCAPEHQDWSFGTQLSKGEASSDFNDNIMRDSHHWYTEFQAPQLILSSRSNDSCHEGCSVSAVFREAFMRKIPLPGAIELMSLLEEKKKAARKLIRNDWDINEEHEQRWKKQKLSS